MLGSEDLFIRQGGLGYRADAVPLGEELTNRVTPAFRDVACSPLFARCSVHPSAGRIGGTSDQMRQ